MKAVAIKVFLKVIQERVSMIKIHRNKFLKKIVLSTKVKNQFYKLGRK
jgi:hypothetical protein